MNKVEFIESKHLYLLNNRVVPSATQIVDFVFPVYEEIPYEVLKKAAAYGTLGHNTFENLIKAEYKTKDILELNIPLELKQSIYDGLRALKQQNIIVKGSEIKVGYKNLYAGTLDLLCESFGKGNMIADLKFTSKLYKDKLRWQLSMYKYAYEDTYEEEIESLHYLWLPKNKKVEFGELDLVPIEEIEKAVRDYEELTTRQ